ncbi:uncharacterized protein LOC132275405 isoform X2 [Cornus florida]|uniref:uncharacterized protein LOC132275405 isoform X2 n=1 Tax=Cornus florida TaxID=4283 RepID=UPI00289A2453|nr:uncharacterized protein LOC132275405 isoform X2 [Cornus florida]
MFGFHDLLHSAATAEGLKSVNRQIGSVTKGSSISCHHLSMLYERCISYLGCDDGECQKLHKALSLHCGPEYLHPKANAVEDGRDPLHDAIMSTNNKAACVALTMMFDECASICGSDHESCRHHREELSRFCSGFEKDGLPTDEEWWIMRFWK